MLTRVADLGPGIRRVTVADDLWTDIEPAVSGVLAEFYEEPVPAGFYPHFNEASLRLALLTAAPRLEALRKAVTDELAGGVRALIIDRLHLADREAAARSRLLYAFCVALGYPTPCNQRRATLLWDIKPSPVPDGRVATFSEHNGEAELHTDSQSYPSPEELFVLYVVRAARCGGGNSYFLSVDELRRTLEATPDGQAALEVLSKPVFPFSISVDGAESNADAVTVRPILGETPQVRFRRDVIERGLKARPDLDTEETRRALDVLLETLAERAPTVTRALPDDSVAVCDNYALLHGRSGFEDRDRHLIRVRLSSRPLALNIADLLSQSGFFSRAVVG